MNVLFLGRLDSRKCLTFHELFRPWKVDYLECFSSLELTKKTFSFVCLSFIEVVS